jgi:septal ring factor EnvC (AmiA/AmiB activator)
VEEATQATAVLVEERDILAADLMATAEAEKELSAYNAAVESDLAALDALLAAARVQLAEQVHALSMHQYHRHHLPLLIKKTNDLYRGSRHGSRLLLHTDDSRVLPWTLNHRLVL